MKDGKINTNKLKVSKFVYLTVFFLFALFLITLIYRCLVDYNVGDITFSQFIENRNIVPFDYFIKTFENREITYICKYEIYNNDLIHYFKEEKHIAYCPTA